MVYSQHFVVIITGRCKYFAHLTETVASCIAFVHPIFFCFVIYPGDVFITVDFKMQETWVRSLRWEDPWRRKWQPAPVFLPGKLHGPRNLVGYSPQGDKESGTTGLTHMHTHTCFTVLCWFLLYNSVNQP